jgi:hypothetical protein
LQNWQRTEISCRKLSHEFFLVFFERADFFQAYSPAPPPCIEIARWIANKGDKMDNIKIDTFQGSRKEESWFYEKKNNCRR